MKTLLRVILSPFILIYALFFMAAMTLFPFPLIVIVSAALLFTYPFVWLFRKAGLVLECIDSPTTSKRFPEWTGYLAGLTIYFWFPFAAIYMFVKHGKIIMNEYEYEL